MTETQLLIDTAQVLVLRGDSASQEVLVEWLADPIKSRRVAAAAALSSHPDKYADVLRERLGAEPSGTIMRMPVSALSQPPGHVGGVAQGDSR
jgi:hypothetical protein